MLAWLGRTVFSGIVGHVLLYIMAGGALFYFGVLWCQKTDVTKIEKINRELVLLREDRHLIELEAQDRVDALKKQLKRYERDDFLHRREIDTLKAIRDRGCLLSDEELQAHPVSPKLRRGFIGRVRQ